MMGRGVNCKVQCKEDNRLLVAELGRRMVAEEWSMAEEIQVKTKNVSGRQSMTFAWVSQNIIAREFSQIYPFSLYLDLAKYNLNENTKQHQCMPTIYKLRRMWSPFPHQMDTNLIPAFTREQEQSPGLYKYHNPGTSCSFSNYPMEVMGES
jgi:hypothetical protein